MRTLKWTLLLVGVLIMLASCMDQEPGEISIRAVQNGEKQGCTVMIFTESGKQIDEKPTDNQGLVFVKNLPPAVYKLKFKSNNGEMFPAEKSVRVISGGSEIVDVELTEAPPAAPAT